MTDRQPRVKLRYLFRALNLVWRSTPARTSFSAVLLVVLGILPLVTLYLTKLTIDAIAAGGSDFGRVGWPIFLTAIAALTTDACRTLVQLVNETQALLVTDYVQSLLHAKSIEVDLEYYENAQYYDTLHRAQAEAPYRPTSILRGFLQLGQSSLALSAIALLLISLHWAIALLLLLAALPALVVRLRYTNRLYRKWRHWTPLERQAYYNSRLLTRSDFAKEVRLFDLGDFLQKRYDGLREGIRSDRIALSTRRSLTDILAQGSATIAMFVAFAFVAHQSWLGKISVGSLVMYLQAFQQGQALLRETLSSFAGLYENTLFLSNFYDFLDLKRAIASPPQPKPIPQPLQTSIRFDRVSFHYPDSDRLVLVDLDLTIHAGETVALVGANGAGKTTLIKLLCRLYDPTDGAITVDGIDLREFDLVAWRQQIGVVFQDFARYNLSVKENIGFSDIQQIDREEKIRHAARRAGAEAAIARLPKGYDTTLGKEFAEGEELSIGEWQKIAIARAFLRDAQIAILDEPTSALDPQAEAEVLQQFRELSRDRTTILIGHRLSTVRMADRIVVLENGCVAEQGSHDELIAKNGIYAFLFATQAHSYR